MMASDPSDVTPIVNLTLVDDVMDQCGPTDSRLTDRAFSRLNEKPVLALVLDCSRRHRSIAAVTRWQLVKGRHPSTFF